jgi:hypothetical protein
MCDPIVALLDIRPEYVLKEFGPDRAPFATGELETLRLTNEYKQDRFN